MQFSARQQFLNLIDLPDGAIDLGRAALVIAKEEYPDLEVAAYLSRLDGMAEALRPRLERARDNPFAAIEAINEQMFGALGFRGNDDQYFDPRNSFLNDVLDRKLGIPITLSLVYMEVARRVGFPLQGVAFPGHFLVRHARQGRDILIDPYHGGEILFAEDCRRRLRESYGTDLPLDQRFFRRATTKQILTRMLNNLRGIYLASGDFDRALGVLDRLMVLTPEDAGVRRDRGVAQLKLRRFGAAEAELKAYLAMAPEARDGEEVRRQIRQIWKVTAQMN